jgi:general L-amino acid transport system permease protein
LATVLFLVALALIGGVALRFLIIDAAWSGGPDSCRAAAGACWPFIAERIGAMLFGFAPEALRGGVGVSAVLLAATLLLERLTPRMRRFRFARAAWALWAAMLFAAIVLGSHSPQGSELGGLLLTLAVSGFAILTGLPLGLLLALARGSKMPLIRALAILWIEFWRGLPTIVVLFFAIAVFPMLAPDGIDLGKLLRTLFAFMLLTSALFAEAIRGGLLAIGEGQHEAAASLGLGSLRTLRLVILPQALAVATPNLVNVCVALVKETTLILVIGLYDLFGIVQTAVLEPRWAGTWVTATGYAAAAAGFLAICATLSHLARRLEAKLTLGR